MWEESERQSEGAVAKTSRQAGWLAGQDIGGRLTACMMQTLLCCAVKRVGGPRTFQTPPGHALGVETCNKVPAIAREMRLS